MDASGKHGLRGFRLQRRPWRFGARTVALAMIPIIAFVAWRRQQAEPPAPEVLPPEQQRVTRIVDGDTFIIEGGARVRLLAIDAPESVKPDHPVEPWGPEASEFVKERILNRPVRLEFDRERLDQHDRWLAYVWYRDSAGVELLLNEELARAGLARVTTHYNNSPTMETRLRKAETEARRAARGIWSTPAKKAA